MTIAPVYDKQYRIDHGYELPARPGHMCITGPDYSAGSLLDKEPKHELTLAEELELLDLKKKKEEEKAAVHEAAKARRRARWAEKRAIEIAAKAELSKLNKARGLRNKLNHTGPIYDII